MSAFLTALQNRIDSDNEITISEFAKIEEFIYSKLPQYSLTKKKIRFNNIEIGKERNVPLNPFTDFEYMTEEYRPLMTYYGEQGCCGEFATKSQWANSGRICKGNPIMKRKMYGKDILYFAFEQTEPDETP